MRLINRGVRLWEPLQAIFEPDFFALTESFYPIPPGFVRRIFRSEFKSG